MNLAESVRIVYIVTAYVLQTSSFTRFFIVFGIPSNTPRTRTPMAKYTSLILFISVYSQLTQAFNLKFRAREHFESNTVKGIQSQDNKYKGLTNTLNIWHEIPLDYSIGLAISPILKGPDYKGGEGTELGKRMHLFHYNIEFKHYLNSKTPYYFYRLGAGRSILKSEGAIKRVWGNNIYAGLGIEFKFSVFGLALEYAVRKSYFADDISVTTQTPSIGFHFYELI